MIAGNRGLSLRHPQKDAKYFMRLSGIICTDAERQRNDRIEAVQGNRNPFIDHPELVCRAWGLECP